MSAYKALRCTKNFPHPNGDQATELLLIQDPDEATIWDVKPRCAEHSAAVDVSLLWRVSPAAVCVIVPLDGAS